MPAQPLRPPVVFPARVNGQRSMVTLTGTRITWQPVPAEFSEARVDGGVIDIADITGVGTHDLGAAKVLRLTATGTVTRMHAAAELIEKLAVHLRPRPQVLRCRPRRQGGVAWGGTRPVSCVGDRKAVATDSGRTPV